VYVDLPKSGTGLVQGASFGSVESVKAVSDIYAPVSGEVVEVNETLASAPEKLNQEPHEGGWLVKVKLSAPEEIAKLLTAMSIGNTLGVRPPRHGKRGKVCVARLARKA
jgi:glycine cleavage system H protein